MDDLKDFLLFLFLVFLGILTVIAVIGIPIGVGVYYVDKSNCHSWGKNTNRPTRFVKYSGPTSWDCLTQSGDGKWISKDQLREFAK